MKVSRKWLVLAVVFLSFNMITATQYAVTKVGYQYSILHPSNARIRFIGSDNNTDGERILRVTGDNSTNVGIILELGDRFAPNSNTYFTAALGIVNEERFTVNITHINVSSDNATYLKIWLHGDRDANANDTMFDPSTVLMWDNTSSINLSNTTAWTLAPGNEDPDDMCYNYTDPTNCSINTTWDETAHVRYSVNDTNAVSNYSDFVWVQIAVMIPEAADSIGLHTGEIWIHLEADTGE